MKVKKCVKQKVMSAVVSVMAATTLAACSNSEPHSLEGATHTGTEETEMQTGILAASNLKAGFQAFVSSERVRVRATPEVENGNLVGVLELNDRVEIVDPARIGEHQFVKVKVLASNAGVAAGTTVFISSNYLNDSPSKPAGVSEDALNTTVVVNVASDKVRIYKKCAPGEGCINRMVFQQDIVNGEDDTDTRTDVGVYRTARWVKFYETMPKYAAWYKPGYPAPPPPKADRAKWFTNKNYTVNSEMRGAFGWYTVHVSPNPNGQWMHGTAGWGADKKSFIMFRHSFMGKVASIFADIDSHGCTRIDNESIALMRSIVPVGARYLKVYAREAVRDPNRTGYSKEPRTFHYIMTKNGAQVTNNHELAVRDVVLANNTPRDQWIEEGTLQYSAYPNPVPFRSKGGTKGSDRYKIGGDNMVGVFLVDEGTFVGYQHPSHKKINVSGIYDDGRPANLPSEYVSSNPNYSVLDNDWKAN